MHKILLLPLVLIGCSPYVDVRGFNQNDMATLKITPKKDTKEDVLKAFGTPTFISSFDKSIWFYSYKKTLTNSFFNPKTIEQKTLVIKFDKKDVVELSKIVDGEIKITPDKETTAVKGHETGFVQDVIGNFGKYSYRKKS